MSNPENGQLSLMQFLIPTVPNSLSNVWAALSPDFKWSALIKKFRESAKETKKGALLPQSGNRTTLVYNLYSMNLF